jgi:N-glycosylase/DNA lyase
MKEYILENPNSFNLTHIFECGQCFRWDKEDDGSYIGVVKNAVIKVKEEGHNIHFFGSDNIENFEKLIVDYFDLNTDYNEYKNKLSNIDEYLKESIEFGSGIRILNQDLWECIISFIISANNNIPRIKKIINKMSNSYGEKIEFDGKNYYTFPDVEALSKATVQDLRNLGLGFRDKRIYNTTQMILNKQVDLNKIENLDDTNKMREELLKLDGVGPKVADCILLFALKRLDVFPIDVWVRRVMNDLYIHNENEEKVNKKELQKLAEEKFLGISGIAQQYLFYWKRESGRSA